MLPRVAFEYGHTWWARCTNSSAVALLMPVDRHSHGDTESFSLSLQRAKRDRRVNRYLFRYPNVAHSRNNSQSPDETSCVARGKQLLRIGAVPFTTISTGRSSFRSICPSSDFAANPSAHRFCSGRVNCVLDCHSEARPIACTI